MKNKVLCLIEDFVSSLPELFDSEFNIVSGDGFADGFYSFMILRVYPTSLSFTSQS